MAEFAPTPSQKAAVEVRGRSVLVSAGAGSGKTRVLTERLMGYLTAEKAPVPITSFVVITFTQAAADELRGRISEELSKAAAKAAAEAPDSERSSWLRRQQALCGKAQIGTIHHFCSGILRENAVKAGISPDFSIADATRADRMKALALDKVLEQRYASPAAYPGFEALLGAVCASGDDADLADAVMQLYSKMQCHSRPAKWAEACLDAIKADATDAGETLWGRQILGDALATAEFCLREMRTLCTIARSDVVISKAYGPSLENTAQSVELLAAALRQGWDAAGKAFPVRFERFGAVRKGAETDTDLAEQIKSHRNACKKRLEGLEKLFKETSSEVLQSIKASAPATEALLSLALDLERAFSAEKRRLNLVDYSDLEHLTAAILTDETGAKTPLAASLAARYTEIMVDEYQDVSLVQDDIFRAVSRDERNLFMVGDVKQSIYRFRLADPEIFNKKYRTYPDYSSDSEQRSARILLRENFRSRREILEGANCVFNACMTASLGDVDYAAGSSLVYGAVGYEDAVPPPELDLYQLPSKEDGCPAPDKVEYEAECVARRIEEMMKLPFPVGPEGKKRLLGYGDIAILLRSANASGGTYRSALMRHGIPVASNQGGGLFNSQEVMYVMNLLRVMDDVYDEIALASALLSPVVGFDENSLASIRAGARDLPFFDALQQYAEKDEKAAGFLRMIRSFRALSSERTASGIIRLLLSETNLLAVCSAMPDGTRRTANLMQLIGIAEGYEGEGYTGLHRFVQFLSALESKNETAPLPVGGGDAVQIVSIHRSKGLEYPVVFLCDTARQFNRSDERDRVLIHPELGLGLNLADDKARVRRSTVIRDAIAARLRRESLSEEMRLQYVALTRAKERLFIVATMQNLQKFLDDQRALLPVDGEGLSPEVLAGANAPVTWFTLAALADAEHRIRLSVLEPVAEAVNAAVPAQENAQTQEPTSQKAQYDALVREALEFAYPHPGAVSLPSKVTATELKHYLPGTQSTDADEESFVLVAPDETDAALPVNLSEGEAEAQAEPFGEAGVSPPSDSPTEPGASARRSFRRPDFSGQQRPATAAERGIATHLALQFIDTDQAATLAGVKSEIERLKSRHFLSERQAKSVNAGAIVRLFRSELGARISRADAVHREFRFSLLSDASAILPTEEHEQILLQGVVDCCLEEAGQLVIIDYKTDRVYTDADIESRRALYESQVKAYAAALQRIFGLPVKETVLYFLSCGKTVTL